MKKNLRIPEGQESLPFQKSTAGLLSFATHRERTLLYVLGATSVVLAILYCYFLMSSVIHVAHRGELSKQIAVLSASVADLESAYLSGSDVVTESYARQLGFVTPSKRAFVERTPTVTLLDTQ